MSNIGDIITVDVDDPTRNDGLEQTAALVTGVYPDGSLRLRVFGPSSTEDTVRNYAGDDGEPFDYEAAAAAPSEPSATDPTASGRQEPSSPPPSV